MAGMAAVNHRNSVMSMLSTAMGKNRGKKKSVASLRSRRASAIATALAEDKHRRVSMMSGMSLGSVPELAVAPGPKATVTQRKDSSAPPPPPAGAVDTRRRSRVSSTKRKHGGGARGRRSIARLNVGLEDLPSREMLALTPISEHADEDKLANDELLDSGKKTSKPKHSS